MLSLVVVACCVMWLAPLKFTTVECAPSDSLIFDARIASTTPTWTTSVLGSAGSSVSALPQVYPNYTVPVSWRCNNPEVTSVSLYLQQSGVPDVLVVPCDTFCRSFFCPCPFSPRASCSFFISLLLPPDCHRLPRDM